MADEARVALVTGGMGGLGEAICRELARTGFKVASTYSPHNERYRQWVATLEADGLHVGAYPMDVTDFDACAAGAARIRDELGPIDVLVNNAGITSDATFAKMSQDAWQKVMHTDLDSLFNVTKQVLPSMIERGWGRIVNISSVNGSKGAFGQTNYSAAKAGVHGFTKALALETATRGVTVNTVSPGYCATDMVMAVPKEVLEQKILPQIPMRRLGRPEEIAHLIGYLCSDLAAFMTGANLAINGGQHMY